jgi:hypothetical protein
MTGDVSIYNLLSGEIQNVYFNKFAQSVKLDEATPKVLIKNITHNNATTKDKLGRDEFSYRIEIIGTNYMNISDTANEVRALMVNHTDEAVYLIDYDTAVYDTNETAEIHRIIQDYRVFINEVNAS